MSQYLNQQITFRSLSISESIQRTLQSLSISGG
jgi:hypothetical protein